MEKNKINEKRIKGVTLIALAVTIIVMLILAGVTIATLTSENGIITQARKAKNKKMAGDIKEAINNEIALITLEEQTEKKELTMQEKKERIIEALKKSGFDFENNKTIKLNNSKTLIIIDTDNVISLLEGEDAQKAEDGLWDWVNGSIPNKEVGICGYNGTDENITIPEYVVYNNEIYTITTLKNCNNAHTQYTMHSPNTATNHLFKNNNIVKSITMLENITTIDGGVFSGNNVIEDIVMSDNVENFSGDASFLNCTNLKSCVLSNSIKILPKYIFQNCALLENVNIPESIVEIQNYAFSGVKSIEKLIIPGNVKKIGMKAFASMGNDNSKLQEIFIEEGVEEIAEGAFVNANTVKVDLHLPSTVKAENIGKNAFAGFGKKVYLYDGTPVSTSWK